MSGRLGGHRSLPARGRLAAEIAATYVSVRILLPRRGLNATVARLRAPARMPESPPTRAERIEIVRRLDGAVARALARLPGDRRCLTRSIVLIAMLARRGIVASVVIGARSEPSFEAHAWVETADLPALDETDRGFRRLTAV